MPESFVRLACPACNKHWERGPTELPGSDDEFDCPDCDETRRTAEFMRTQRDLEILQEF